MRKALLLSIVTHAALLVGARPIAAQIRAHTATVLDSNEPDRWTGTSVEIATSLDPPAAGAAAPPSPAEPAPPPPPSQPAAPSPPDTPAAASPAPSAAPAIATNAAPSAATESRPPVAAKPKKTKRSRSSHSKPASAPASPSSSSTAGPAASSAPASPSASAGSGEGSGGTFGAEGQAAVRDLGRAFTRAIPAACSADPTWGKLTAGDAGTLVAELRVSADGHLGSMEPMGKDPPKALVNVLRRTLPLLQAGTFAVRGGAVSAGTETIELKATVSDDAGGDAAEGAHDNLAFAYSNGRGKASFTQTGGRRVEIAVRVIKVEVDP